MTATTSLMGLLGLVVGGYALLNPPLSMLAFVYLFAFRIRNAPERLQERHSR
jgi:uncharacterized membrane protein HdeD (DUF308 family)